MNCFWEGFLTFILGMLGIVVYLGLFAGLGYLLGKLFGREPEDCIPFAAIAVIIAMILGGGILVGLSECGII